MGEEFVRLDGSELHLVTVKCPHCGVGLQVDLTKPIYGQLKGQLCTCGEVISKNVKELLTAYKTAWDIIHDQQCKVKFDIKVER